MKMAMMTATATAILFATSMAFAQGAGTEAPKMSKKEAKAACKAEGHKGKEMKACMKEKMGK